MTVRLEERLRVRTREGLRLDVQRFFPPFILAGYGIFVLSLFARNLLSWYINPSYTVPTTLAGAVLVGLAAVTLARRREQICADEECCGVNSCGCEEPSPHLRTYAVLALPLVLGLVFPAHGLAAVSALQRGPQFAGMGLIHGSAAVKGVSLSIDTRNFTMSDWVGALSADPNPKDFTGKPIVVTGMVLHDSSSMPPGYVMVMRYLITCCIADARPVGLIVRDSAGTLRDNEWVTVTGTMSSTSYQGQNITVVAPKTIVPVKSQNPYIY